MITFKQMRPEMLSDWSAHCSDVFGAKDSDTFRRLFLLDPDRDPSLVFIAEDGGEIVSAVHVFVRRMWLHGRCVSMGGIGDVSTKPAYRRRGLATRLLKMAIAAMTARGMPVSVLFGDQGIYRRAGWVFCPARATIAVTAQLDALPPGAAIRPFAPADLDAVMGLYDLYAGRMDGALLRPDAYWRRWVLPKWKDPQVLLMEGRPMGYACAGRDGPVGEMAVRELAMAPQATPYLAGFLRALLGAAGCDRLRIQAPLAPGLPGITYEDPTYMMVRLNLPLAGIASSQALAQAMPNAGICQADLF